jgi:hypothetical protein
VQLPTPTALWGLTGRFCLAGGVTKAHRLPQQPNQPQPLLGKPLFFGWKGCRDALPAAALV